MDRALTNGAREAAEAIGAEAAWGDFDAFVRVLEEEERRIPGAFGPSPEPPKEPQRHMLPLAALFEQIDGGQRERGVDPLSEEDAMRLANQELHAMRREGGAGGRQRVER